MMSSTNPHWTFLLWLTAWLWLGQSRHGVVGNTDLHQKMKYHLTELRKGLYEMQASHVHKRSVNLDHDTIIYNSLLAFCSQMNLQNNLDPRTDTTTNQPPNTSLGYFVIPSTTSVPVDKNDFWQSSKLPLPDLFPVKVQAEVVGEKVRLVFHIIHSWPAYIARIQSFDYKKTVIKYPRNLHGSSTPIQSEIRLEVDASVCGDEKTESSMQAEFLVWTHDDKSSYSEQMSVDICMFDKDMNKTRHRPFETRKDKTIFSQDIPRPEFKVLSNKGNKIVVEKGKNISFEMDVHLFQIVQLAIHVRVWDRSLGKVFTSRAVLSVFHSGSVGVRVESSDYEYFKKLNLVEKLLTVKVINETKYNSTDTDGYGDVSARVRVIVNTANGHRSGVMFLEYLWSEPDFYLRPIVRMMRTTQKVLLVLPKKPGVLPRNDVEIFNAGKFQCDDEGMRRYPKHGRNCTVACHVYGTNIQSVTIKKTNSKMSPVRSVSYVVGNSAFAMWDVGPASRNIEGHYKCVVATSRGHKKKKNMSLYTSQFTRVGYLTLKEFNNGSSRVICKAFGAQPLNISIFTSDVDSRENRIFILPAMWVFTTGDERKSIIIISTDFLKYPREWLTCHAIGERGEDGQKLQLSSNIKNQNPYEAKINRMPNATFVSDYGNGTATITCAATGKNLTIWVTRGTPYRDDRIDDKPENVRVVRETAEGKTLILLMPRKSLATGPSVVYCRAENQFGDDGFKIPISMLGM